MVKATEIDRQGSPVLSTDTAPAGGGSPTWKPPLTMTFQPRVDCATGALAAVAVGARVVGPHPDAGTIEQGEPLPAWQPGGFAERVNGEVLAQAIPWFCRHFVTRPDQRGLSAPLLAATISTGNLHNVDFTSNLASWCANAGLPQERLVLEIAESHAMENPLLSMDAMIRLRMKGFQLSLDHFGAGYSSLALLVRMPFSEVKVDPALVGTALASPGSRAALGSLVELGRNLGVRTTAEGVEDAATLGFLREIGCDLAQGRHIAPAMDGADLLRWVRDQG